MDLSHHNDSLCSLSNFEANQNSNISTVKTDASNKKILLNEYSNSPLNYSCDKYSQPNSELKENQQDEEELFSNRKGTGLIFPDKSVDNAWQHQ